MQLIIDARGLACPIPQMKTMATIRSYGWAEIVVLVDEAAARDSVVRAARALGLPYRVERDGEEFRLTIVRGERHG